MPRNRITARPSRHLEEVVETDPDVGPLVEAARGMTPDQLTALVAEMTREQLEAFVRLSEQRGARMREQRAAQLQSMLTSGNELLAALAEHSDLRELREDVEATAGPALKAAVFAAVVLHAEEITPELMSAREEWERRHRSIRARPRA
jgi:hypothetical protein